MSNPGRARQLNRAEVVDAAKLMMPDESAGDQDMFASAHREAVDLL